MPFNRHICILQLFCHGGLLCPSLLSSDWKAFPIFFSILSQQKCTICTKLTKSYLQTVIGLKTPKTEKWFVVLFDRLHHLMKTENLSDPHSRHTRWNHPAVHSDSVGEEWEKAIPNNPKQINVPFPTHPKQDGKFKNYLDGHSLDGRCDWHKWEAPLVNLRLTSLPKVMHLVQIIPNNSYWAY